MCNTQRGVEVMKLYSADVARSDLKSLLLAGKKVQPHSNEGGVYTLLLEYHAVKI